MNKIALLLDGEETHCNITNQFLTDIGPEKFSGSLKKQMPAVSRWHLFYPAPPAA
jgi:hypothetical protein